MKTRTIITAVAIALVGFFFARSCGVDSRLKQARAEYEEYRRIVEEENAQVSARVENLTNQIVEKDKAIGQLEHKVAQYVDELSTLRGELTDIQDAEPSQPELESEPLVINLRSQVAKLTEMFTLANNVIATQSQEIDVLRGKVKLWEEVAGEWKEAYNREHQLRVQAESLFKMYERGQRLNKFWRTTAVVATGAVAGLLLLK